MTGSAGSDVTSDRCDWCGARLTSGKIGALHPATSDVRSDAVEIAAQALRLMRERDRYRRAIRSALGAMNVTDRELGEGGAARRAYAHLWHEYHAIPAGIPASDITALPTSKGEP